MNTPGIFNDVLGPVMRGPSSSHTAGSHRIGKIAGMLTIGKPANIDVTFDAGGSYAVTYGAQGSDKAFLCGILGIDLIDPDFFRIFEIAKSSGIQVGFHTKELAFSDHPNTVLIETTSANGSNMRIIGKSVGGGNVVITKIQDHEVRLTGKESNLQEQLLSVSGLKSLNKFEPIYLSQSGDPLFSSAKEMIEMADKGGLSLGEIAIKYESQLLEIPEHQVYDEMLRRYRLMVKSIKNGLNPENSDMMLLEPSASSILSAEKDGGLAIGGLHSKAALYAMATMHSCNSFGTVIAAPTGGAAGVIPGTIYALAEEKDLPDRPIVNMLFAASAIGLIVSKRATFAAEVCGCQVEIGAAGAMASAAVIEYAGGNARQAVAAAAVALQNTMGSVCDLVQGACEIPCHTRNAVAASSAFVNADLILGGYQNPVPLDETIDAMYAVGKMLPVELRCTSKGGIAVAPSALGLASRRG